MTNIKEQKSTPTPSFFAASNSGRGFVSYFDKVFKRDKYNKVYILKGGPGTGKSSLMKAAEREAAKKGYRCEAILCSSDPNSYDGVIIKSKDISLSILDGTAPHATDTEIPGAVDEIINLGQFWKEQVLGDKRDRITELISKKSSCYKCAYAILKSAESYAVHKRAMLSRCIDEDKLKRAVERLLSFSNQKELYPQTEYKLRNAISAEGYKGTDIYSCEDGMHFAITGVHGAAFAFFDALHDTAIKKSLSLTLSPSPLSPDIYDAVALPYEGMYFCFCESANSEYCDKVINTERFLHENKLREIKPTLRLLSRLEKEACDSAVKMLGEAKKYHFELEDIYTAAMDFDKKEKMQKQLLEKII